MDRREVVLEDVVLKSMSAVNGGVGDVAARSNVRTFVTAVITDTMKI